jgi:plasmid maintenance system antidote protein VapI
MKAMDIKNITVKQLAELLECRTATVSDKLNGKRECGFYYEEAERIKKVFFSEYELGWLFERKFAS